MELPIPKKTKEVQTIKIVRPLNTHAILEKKGVPEFQPPWEGKTPPGLSKATLPGMKKTKVKERRMIITKSHSVLYLSGKEEVFCTIQPLEEVHLT